MNADPNQAKALFLEAVEKHDPDGWPAFLEQACAGQPDLRRRVEVLLAAHREAGTAQHQAPAEVSVPIDGSTSAERPGTVIGPYKLLQQIGEGGMGTVFMAEQAHPVQRKVALKVIKAGMDSRQVIARFEAEREALAMMDHVNIARVFDGGTTSGEPGGVSPGRPYFVMELVHGVPITKYCDDNHLTPRQRLELFVPVCQAIQHAHQKGIIHRDIKPSNVMVTLYDGKPVPKVIDFGVAKATEQKLTERTLFTQYGTMVGTLEYMSPEQAEMSALGVDTRSDIYSLGVLLYELLTGSTPLTHKRLKEAAYGEILRLIKEEEPPRPSTRLSDSGEALASISAQRHMEPAKLAKLVRGELDWIVMKTLEKDRNRRYETASAFAADVQRYLDDEAVQACPPSGWYRFRKFARRNKTQLALTGVILFFLVLLGSGGGWMVRDRAAREEEVLRDRAARQAVLADRVVQALKEAADRQAQGRWIEALAGARRAEELLAAEGSDELRRQARELRADLEMVAQLAAIRLQSTAVKDGRFDIADRDPAYAQVFREHGFDLARGGSGAETAQLIGAKGIRVELAAALDDWARACRVTRPKADTTWKDLLAIARAADPDPFRKQLRDSWEGGDFKALENLAAAEKAGDLPTATVELLGNVLADSGAVQAVIDLLRRAQLRRPADFWINHNLASALFRMQPRQLDEAIGYYRAALGLRPESPAVHSNLGLALCNKGRLDEAIAEYQEAIRLKKDFALAHSNLGAALGDKGRLDEAVAEYQEAIRLKKDFAEAHYNLGNALRDKGRLDEAIAEYQETIRLKKDNPKAHNNLGLALVAKGRLDEAIAECQEAIRLKKDFALAHLNLGAGLYHKGRLDEAIAEFREAIRLKKDFAVAHYNLGNAFCDKGRLDEAIAELQGAVRLKKDFVAAHYNLGNAFYAKGRLDEAIAEYQEAIHHKKNYAEAHAGLGAAFYHKGRLDEAVAEYQEAIRLKKDLPEAHYGLGKALREKRRLDEAITEYGEAIRINKNDHMANYNLGNALRDKGRLDEAIAAYREAVRLNKDYPDAHCNLGHALRSKGRYAESLACLRRGHELGSRNPRWSYPSAKWVRDGERLVALKEKLPELLSGKVQPADTVERLALAQLCQVYKKRYGAAARFYAAAFAADPSLSRDQPSDDRYNAACAAALAGCGQGEDAKSLDDKERARLRAQALNWLRADLAAWRQRLEKEPAKARPAVLKQMQHWLVDLDFAGVRGSEALERLPAAERPDWQKLWQEVEALRQRAAAPVGPAKIDKKALLK